MRDLPVPGGLCQSVRVRCMADGTVSCCESLSREGVAAAAAEDSMTRANAGAGNACLDNDNVTFIISCHNSCVANGRYIR